MKTLWTSQDGYVRVVSGLTWPDENEPELRSDLEQEFRTGAWIVIWQGIDSPRWFFCRSRRMAKPSLNALRKAMRETDTQLADAMHIQAEDRHGFLKDEYNADPVEIAQAMYAAWQSVAGSALPAKLAHLVDAGHLAAAEEYAAEQIPAWLRPGLTRYTERRHEIRALLEERYA